MLLFMVLLFIALLFMVYLFIALLSIALYLATVPLMNYIIERHTYKHLVYLDMFVMY